MDSMPAFTVISDCETKVFMEALTGGLLGHQEMKAYISSRMIEEQGLGDVKKVRREFARPRLDPGQVADYLELDQGEWLRWIDVPEIISRDNHWLLVGVDTETGVVHNLPSRWRRNLEPLLLAQAGGVRINNVTQVASTDTSIEPKMYEERLTSNELLLSRYDHFSVLEKALKIAKTIVFVASAFFDTSEVDNKVRELILGALKRGVQVCFLWGYAVYHGELKDEAALNWLRGLRKEAGEYGRRLKFNDEATDSHAKMLIYDDDAGFNGYVGSCNWLSACLALKGDTRQPTEVTIGIKHPALIASLCRSAAGFWTMSKRGGFADAPELLRRAAEQLDVLAQKKEAAGSETSSDLAKVRIIRDQEHETKMRELLFSAKNRCLVISNKFGAKAAIRLTPLVNGKEKRCAKTHIQFSKMTPGAPSGTDIASTIGPIADCVKQIASRHSKIVVVDDTAIISSYNFLSADPFGNFFNAREVGVLIQGGNIPDLLWSAHSK